jgi:hypothetical protein
MSKGRVAFILLAIGFVAATLAGKPKQQAQEAREAAAATTAPESKVSNKRLLQQQILNRAAERARAHCEYMRRHGAACY